jgi:hypothetical protein
MDLVAEARAIDWDFTNWCDVSGYDASDPDARRVFECLLAYARREGRAGLNWPAGLLHPVPIPANTLTMLKTLIIATVLLPTLAIAQQSSNLHLLHLLR